MRRSSSRLEVIGKLGWSQEPLPCLLKIAFSGVTSTDTVSWLLWPWDAGFCLLWTRHATAARMRRVVTTETEVTRTSSVVSSPRSPALRVSDSGKANHYNLVLTI